jgi:hypothetical protein
MAAIEMEAMSSWTQGPGNQDQNRTGFQPRVSQQAVITLVRELTVRERARGQADRKYRSSAGRCIRDGAETSPVRRTSPVRLPC